MLLNADVENKTENSSFVFIVGVSDILQKV